MNGRLPLTVTPWPPPRAYRPPTTQPGLPDASGLHDGQVSCERLLPGMGPPAEPHVHCSSGCHRSDDVEPVGRAGRVEQAQQPAILPLRRITSRYHNNSKPPEPALLALVVEQGSERHRIQRTPAAGTQSCIACLTGAPGSPRACARPRAPSRPTLATPCSDS